MTARVLAALTCAATLAACAGDQLKLFPGRDGNATGGVAVIDEATGNDLAMIDRAGSKAAVGARGARVGQFDEAALPKRDRALLANLPPPVYVANLTGFGSEDATLTPVHITLLQGEVVAQIAQHPAAEIEVIGYTSASGSDAINDPLSVKRAEQVRAEISKLLNIPADKILATGRGSRKLLIEADPDSSENRRVEIVVR